MLQWNQVRFEKKERKFLLQQRLLQDCTKKFSVVRVELERAKQSLINTHLQCQRLETRAELAETAAKQAIDEHMAMLHDRDRVSGEVANLRATVSDLRLQEQRNFITSTFQEPGMNAVHKNETLYIRQKRCEVFMCCLYWGIILYSNKK